jgi:lysyl-tRNA synthetase class 2
MLEFYQAYSDFSDLMNLTEELLRELCVKICGSTTAKFGDVEIDFAKIERLSMRDAVVKYWPPAAAPAPEPLEFASQAKAEGVASRYNDWARSTGGDLISDIQGVSAGELTGELFERLAEQHLIQPTFIYDFPTEISPLSKCHADDPSLAERFELFIAGM